MIRKSVKVSEEIFQKFLNETIEGTHDEKIIELLSLKNDKNRLGCELGLQIKANEKAAQRILELEEAKTNIIEGQSSPDKQRRLDFDTHAFDQKLEFAKMKHSDEIALGKLDQFVKLGIMLIKKDIVSKHDMEPILKKVMPGIADLLGAPDFIEGEVSAAIEESKKC